MSSRDSDASYVSADGDAIDATQVKTQIYSTSVRIHFPNIRDKSKVVSKTFQVPETDGVW